MNVLKINDNRLSLILVLFVAFLLRFWSLWHMPFMHDEFSALFRTEFSNINDLVRYGVAENDTHPAGVQVFLYYWVKIVGYSEFWVKLPFVFAGILSVLLLFIVAKRWFNETVALAVASFMAVMQFFVFYSQLARPYAMGLFGVLWLVWQWTKIVQIEKLKPVDWILLVLSLWFTALMHAFSLFSAGLIWLTGFLFLPKKRIRNYWMAGIAAVILYSPHIPVFWQQLKRGDLGGWLGPPTANFLTDFLFYSFHFSWLFVVISSTVFGFSLLHALKTDKRLWYFRIASLSWFVVSFVVAYLYSVYRSPLLQFSTLIFTFPFVLLFLFSFLRNLKPVNNLLMVIMLLGLGGGSLIFQRQHFQTMYRQGYDQSAKEAASVLSEDTQTALVFYSSTPSMHTFYLKKEGVSGFTLFSKHDSNLGFREYVSQCQTPRLLLSLADGGPLEWASIAQNKYPHLLRHKVWFNTELFLFSKEKEAKQVSSLSEQFTGFVNLYHVENKEFTSERVYGPSWKANWDSLCGTSNKIFTLTASGIATDTLINVRMVLEIVPPAQQKPLHWQAATLDQDTVYPGQKFFLTTVLRSSLITKKNHNSLLRSYLWNMGKESFSIDSYQLEIRHQPSAYYGIFEPL